MNKLFISAIAALALVSCGGNSSSNNGTADADSTTSALANDSTAQTDEPANLADIEVTTDGTINETEWKAGETASVSISRIPTSIGEFKGLQERIGKTPEGAVVLQLVAFEMYHQNKSIGEQCIRLNNEDTNINPTMRRIKEVYSDDKSYARPYLVASYIDGATPQNGYNPTKPYTFKVRTNAGRQYERSEMLKGYVLYLEVYSSGYDTPWRSCEVIKQKGSDFYKVSNSPSLYVQCKEVPFDADKDYQGI